MCDYSLQNVKTRPAKVGDKLFTRRFSSGTGGFSAPEDVNVAVCLLPGREPSFAYEVRRSRSVAVEQKYSPPQNGDLPAGQYRLPAGPSRCVGIS